MREDFFKAEARTFVLDNDEAVCGLARDTEALGDSERGHNSSVGGGEFPRSRIEGVVVLTDSFRDTCRRWRGEKAHVSEGEAPRELSLVASVTRIAPALIEASEVCRGPAGMLFCELF